MGLQRIQDALKKQMAERRLRFNITDELDLREVIEETSDYISEYYESAHSDAEKVKLYLDDCLEAYPEHIEPIREYIEPIYETESVGDLLLTTG